MHKSLPAAIDRGPARYFHGRKQILRDFSELLERAIQTNTGTTFLVRGGPGAGKSALLFECEKVAEAAGWKVAEVDPPAFWDLDELKHSLGLRKEINVEGGAARFGVPGIAGAEVSAGRSAQTVKGLLQKGKGPLLLILDEAQALGDKSRLDAERGDTAVSVLKAIHNGRLGKPVVLLAAGLGKTVTSFRSFKISRFALKCFVELGALSQESERAVIRDWLKKEGGAKGDLAEWIGAIARETHGWPHHILSYGPPAADQLNQAGGAMTARGLKVALEAGQAGREAYYDERVDEFPEEERQALACAFINVPVGGSRTRHEILASITQDSEPAKAEDLFDRAWGQGVLDMRQGRYVITVPSMQDWLISNYGREQIKMLESDRVRHRSPGRGIGG